ncbi:ion channel [Candidatus Nitrospira neomarina]|uniref:Ion channel n=1 Tax=Candidatus Nitrospira neomarina TaxID=3020899 RepID=A0AA96GR89_9BACT|nr:ion channel [Candidatus Nitrospira neomarina]WNM62599.1 ion channel [Candidatus Nitrospira neomarina]
MSIVLGLSGTAVLAAVHVGLLFGISRLVPRHPSSPPFVTFYVFCLLALTHFAEISLYAAYLAGLEKTLYPGSLIISSPEGSYRDWLYFSGINFTTLGFTSQHVNGPLRLVSMFESLAGFMLLTWSATYLYSICGKYWEK